MENTCFFIIIIAAKHKICSDLNHAFVFFSINQKRNIVAIYENLDVAAGKESCGAMCTVTNLDYETS